MSGVIRRRAGFYTNQQRAPAMKSWTTTFQCVKIYANQHRKWLMKIKARKFPKLEAVTSPTVGTAAAAHYLNRRQQTLRGWACRSKGLIQPVRVGARLAWPVAEIKRVLGVAA